MGSSSETIYMPPETIDYGESMRDALQAQVDMAEQLYRAEADSSYGRPAYSRLEQKIAKNAMIGERKQVDQDGYVVTDRKNFDKNKFVQFESQKDAILAKAREIDPSLGVYEKILKGQDADGTWWENAHNQGFTYGSDDEKNIVGRWNMWRAEHKATTGQDIVTPESGKNAPYYERGNTSNIADPESGIVREYVGKESAGKEVYSGGITELVGGRQQTEYFNEDGTKTTRQAGFDENGEFLGAQKFEQDLRQREQRSTIANELGLVGEYGQQATDLYRQQGGIQDALDETERLGQMSAIPRYQSNDIFGLVDNPQPTMFAQNQQNLGNLDQAKAQEDYDLELEEFEAQTAKEEKEIIGRINGSGSLGDPKDMRELAEFKKRQKTLREKLQARNPISKKFKQPGGIPEIVKGLKMRMPEQGANFSKSNQPSSRGLNQQMLAQAQEGMQAGGRLTARELRTAQQGARMASSARGRGRDFSGVLAELNFGEQASRARETQRQNFAGQVMNTQMGLMDRSISQKQINDQLYQQGLQMDRGYATQRVGLETATSADPFQAILGRPSGVQNQAGQAVYGNAYAGVGASPQLYNPAQGAQFEANQASELNSYNSAYAGAEATRKAGESQMWGNIIGGAVGGVTGGLTKKYL